MLLAPCSHPPLPLNTPNSHQTRNADGEEPCRFYRIAFNQQKVKVRLVKALIRGVEHGVRRAPEATTGDLAFDVLTWMVQNPDGGPDGGHSDDGDDDAEDRKRAAGRVAASLAMLFESSTDAWVAHGGASGVGTGSTSGSGGGDGDGGGDRADGSEAEPEVELPPMPEGVVDVEDATALSGAVLALCLHGNMPNRELVSLALERSHGVVDEAGAMLASLGAVAIPIEVPRARLEAGLALALDIGFDFPTVVKALAMTGDSPERAVAAVLDVCAAARCWLAGVVGWFL